MKRIFPALIFLLVSSLSAQEIDPDLQIIKTRLDSLETFTAKVELNVDISFINMPTKYAIMHYKKGQSMQFESNDFVMIPKRGLDLSMRELFKHPFITVDRGTETLEGSNFKKLNIIPTDQKADFAIATVWINPKLQRIKKSEISTKKDGTFNVVMDYKNQKDILPSDIVISFEIEKIKLPIQYLAKEVDLNRKEMRSQKVKTGKILLSMSDYQIEKIK
ncbi:hypothetical protein [Galbibacter sp. BG1]|uniref:hypothetical protein n=1 Tax=Galbibacter sp. BG1 TaxID=1170699 RepID=UPI0021044021|nr:hypothetical protein [Galbibacter sp. BG1]